MSPFSLNTLVFSQFSATLLAVESHNPISLSSLSCEPSNLRQDVLTLNITKNFSPLDDFRFATIMPGEIASSRLPLPDQPTSANDPCPGHRNIDRSHPRATTMPQDPATGRHRPGRRSHPPLLPTRTAAGPQSSARSLAIGTLPPRLPAPRRSPLAHRPAQALIVLLKNLLLSREPLYGAAHWAARYDPAALGLDPQQIAALNDDRFARALDQLFRGDCSSLALTVATHAVKEFQVELDELHNDSTTLTFSGDYADAAQESRRRGQPRLAITWGHNKDHRPDLKQLLFILTVSKDGGIPVYFQAKSGNVADDTTHRDTWDLLCKLAGRVDFLYVADCKFASTENMGYVHGHGGRFLTVLPRTRSEDRLFRAALAGGRVRWRRIHDKYDEKGDLIDRYRVSEPATTSAEGYRLVWYHSCARRSWTPWPARQPERTWEDLAELQQKLTSPRTRYRQAPR